MILDTLKVEEFEYRRNFLNDDFGMDLVKHVLSLHNDLPQSPLARVKQGSSLIFGIGDSFFLKLTPPFLLDCFHTEIQVTKLVSKRLTVNHPEILQYGEISDWRYIITRAVPGVQARQIFPELTQPDLMKIARELGAIIREYSAIDPKDFKREFGPWNDFLANRIKNQKNSHMLKGTSEAWAEKIWEFVKPLKNELAGLGPSVLDHADFNREHVLLERRNGFWGITGILDLADSMLAPLEVEFILPCLDFFRGDRELQDQLFQAAGYQINFERKQFSNVMLALTLQNRFIEFENWFRPELHSGTSSLGELANKIFPY